MFLEARFDHTRLIGNGVDVGTARQQQMNAFDAVRSRGSHERRQPAQGAATGGALVDTRSGGEQFLQHLHVGGARRITERTITGFIDGLWIRAFGK